MMMTSGQAVKYRGSMHCMSEVVKNEGMKSLFKGAGANILRAVAGAGVLSGYDAMQVGACPRACMHACTQTAAWCRSGRHGAHTAKCAFFPLASLLGTGCTWATDAFSMLS